MRKPEADLWALGTLRLIAQRAPFETTHIELKRQLPEPKAFARQLGGLANAARWEPVLVLIGVDQKDGIVGTAAFEVGDWYAALRSCFEYGEAPTLATCNFLTFDGEPVAALVFDTDNPPYVVIEGKKGGPREVPWRYGSNTGVAGRAELLSVLVQQAHDPQIDVMRAELRIIEPNHTMQLSMEVFVFPPPGGDPISIPHHWIDVTATDMNGNTVSMPVSVSLTPRTGATLAKLLDSATVIPAVAKLTLTCFSSDGQTIEADSSVAEVGVSVRGSRFAGPIRFYARLTRRDHPDTPGYWELSEDHAKKLHTRADDMEELRRQLGRWEPRVKPPSFL